jgi:hypothetical protein
MRIFPNTTAYPAPQRNGAMAFVCFGLHAVAFGEGALFEK